MAPDVARVSYVCVDGHHFAYPTDLGEPTHCYGMRNGEPCTALFQRFRKLRGPKAKPAFSGLAPTKRKKGER